MFRTTILAARRVLPPDLMTPAEASAARMNDTGPEAVPPPPRRSFEERIPERFTPEPDPPLKMTPSRRYQSRIESIVSLTERMKQAEHCGFSSTPTLNQTGELNEAFCLTRRCVSSSANTSASPGVAKYPCSSPQLLIERTTRPTSCFTLVSRSGVPGEPRKYFEATTLVASCDHAAGTSMSFCSKTTSPPSPLITALRRSQVSLSIGSIRSRPARSAASSGSVKRRCTCSPFAPVAGVVATPSTSSETFACIDLSTPRPPFVFVSPASASPAAATRFRSSPARPRVGSSILGGRRICHTTCSAVKGSLRSGVRA